MIIMAHREMIPIDHMQTILMDETNASSSALINCDGQGLDAQGMTRFESMFNGGYCTVNSVMTSPECS